ncbi:MAG: septum formation initiator family protein [Verrucomicrobiota bacterium]
MNRDSRSLPQPAQIGGLDIWQKLNRVIMVLVALIVSGALIAEFLPEIRRQGRLDQEIADLQDQERELREKRDELEREYQWLLEEKEFQESIARDRLDLQREGETIVRIQR